MKTQYIKNYLDNEFRTSKNEVKTLLEIKKTDLSLFNFNNNIDLIKDFISKNNAAVKEILKNNNNMNKENKREFLFKSLLFINSNKNSNYDKVNYYPRDFSIGKKMINKLDIYVKNSLLHLKDKHNESTKNKNSLLNRLYNNIRSSSTKNSNTIKVYNCSINKNKLFPDEYVSFYDNNNTRLTTENNNPPLITVHDTHASKYNFININKNNFNSFNSFSQKNNSINNNATDTLSSKVYLNNNEHNKDSDIIINNPNNILSYCKDLKKNIIPKTKKMSNCSNSSNHYTDSNPLYIINNNTNNKNSLNNCNSSINDILEDNNIIENLKKTKPNSLVVSIKDKEKYKIERDIDIKNYKKQKELNNITNKKFNLSIDVNNTAKPIITQHKNKLVGNLYDVNFKIKDLKNCFLYKNCNSAFSNFLKNELFNIHTTKNNAKYNINNLQLKNLKNNIKIDYKADFNSISPIKNKTFVNENNTKTTKHIKHFKSNYFKKSSIESFLKDNKYNKTTVNNLNKLFNLNTIEFKNNNIKNTSNNLEINVNGKDNINFIYKKYQIFKNFDIDKEFNNKYKHVNISEIKNYNNNKKNSKSLSNLNKEELYKSFKKYEKQKTDDLSSINFRFSENRKKVNFLLKKSFK